LEWGDWASWVVALFTLASFGAVALGLYVENQHRKEDLKTERKNREADIKRVQCRQEKLDKRQNDLDEQAAYLLESEQARHVGAFITWPPSAKPSEEQDVAEMTVVNASDLPISNIRGYVISFSHRQTVCTFPQIAVVYSHKDEREQAYVDRTTSMNERQLVLVYDDDSGVRWRKYLDHPSPHKLEDRTADLPWRDN
jgi:hypothetical protein